MKMFENIISGLIGAFILWGAQRIYWYYKISPYIKKIKELEEKYLQGWHPDNICESCFGGRYKHSYHQKDTETYARDHWICEKCSHYASPDWKRRKYHC